jgi:phospholipid/cholesterol/gamma-HCH transport system substrate-binding protein
MAAVAGKSANIVKVAVIGLVVVLVIGAVYLLTGGSTKTGTAYFKTANSIYPGDAIRILGMEVGSIDKVTPESDKVRIDFHYDGKYTVPADVKAALMSPTLVATRFIQLDPAYTGGPEFEDGATIPMERTVVPVEFDELKKQLDQISDALGPDTPGERGALNRALDTIQKNGVQDGVGQGQNFHDMITELSKAAKTVSDGRGDLFGTIKNLSTFTSTLNRYDAKIVEFDGRLADVSGLLADNTRTFRELLPKVDEAGKEVDKFLEDNGPRLTETVDRAGSFSRNLAKSRMDLAQALHIAPNALINFTNLFNPRTGEIFANVAPNNLASLGSQGDGICALISTAAAPNEWKGQQECVNVLGPIFKQVAIGALPVGASPVTAPRGSTPTYGDIDDGPEDTDPAPNGSGSDLPPSSSRNGNDRTYDGPGGLGGLLKGGN